MGVPLCVDTAARGAEWAATVPSPLPPSSLSLGPGACAHPRLERLRRGADGSVETARRGGVEPPNPPPTIPEPFPIDPSLRLLVDRPVSQTADLFTRNQISTQRRPPHPPSAAHNLDINLRQIFST